MPHTRDSNLAHYKTMLADFEYELMVQTRRGGSEVDMLRAAVARTRNTIAALMASRNIGCASTDTGSAPQFGKKTA